MSAAIGFAVVVLLVAVGCIAVGFAAAHGQARGDEWRRWHRG